MKKRYIIITILMIITLILIFLPLAYAGDCSGSDCSRECVAWGPGGCCCKKICYMNPDGVTCWGGDQTGTCCGGPPPGPCTGKSANYVCDQGDNKRCAGTGCGDNVQKRHWVKRCGSSNDACPNVKEYTEPWQTEKNCANNQKCDPGTYTCVDTAQCECAGKPAGTRCDGTGYRLRCGGDNCGDDVERRNWVRECDGTSNDCPSQRHWRNWFVKKNCASNEKCDSSINDCAYAAECDDDNNQTLCEEHGYIWINNKCCGNSDNEYIKNSYDGCRLGCCERANQCLVTPRGNPDNNNQPDRYYSPDASDRPRCIKSGQFIEDKLCIGGEWYSRTGIVATQLLSFSDSLGQDFSMYCGSYDDVLNYFGYKTSEGTYIREYFENYCLINTEYVPCFNNLCVLKQSDLVLIGGSLNAQNYGVMFKAFNYTGTCSNALAENYNRFVRCTPAGPAELWFKSNTDMFIYENRYSQIQKPSSFVDAFRVLITRPLRAIARFLTSIINPPRDYSMLPYVADWKKPTDLYFNTAGGRRVVATYEKGCFGELEPPNKKLDNKARILVVEYNGFSFDFCEVINELNPTICYKDGNRYFVVIGKGEIEDPLPVVWASLTGKLRIVPSSTSGIPAEKYCNYDGDCACGVHIDTGACFYGNKDYVGPGLCPDFCSGFAGNLIIKCIDNECKQVPI